MMSSANAWLAKNKKIDVKILETLKSVNSLHVFVDFRERRLTVCLACMHTTHTHTPT